jgi:hypothetical protein
MGESTGFDSPHFHGPYNVGTPVKSMFVGHHFCIFYQKPQETGRVEPVMEYSNVLK